MVKQECWSGLGDLLGKREVVGLLDLTRTYFPTLPGPGPNPSSPFVARRVSQPSWWGTSGAQSHGTRPPFATCVLHLTVYTSPQSPGTVCENLHAVLGNQFSCGHQTACTSNTSYVQNLAWCAAAARAARVAPARASDFEDPSLPPHVLQYMPCGAVFRAPASAWVNHSEFGSGRFYVPAQDRGWKFVFAKHLPATTVPYAAVSPPVQRRQLPVTDVAAMTACFLQGQTVPAATFDFSEAPDLSRDILWMSFFVLLSRVPPVAPCSVPELASTSKCARWYAGSLASRVPPVGCHPKNNFEQS